MFLLEDQSKWPVVRCVYCTTSVVASNMQKYGLLWYTRKRTMLKNVTSPKNSKLRTKVSIFGQRLMSIHSFTSNFAVVLLAGTYMYLSTIEILADFVSRTVDWERQGELSHPPTLNSRTHM